MSAQPKCILVTGMGHSGTRLVVNMLSKHPDISVPLTILNRVAEYTPIQKFFIRTLDEAFLGSDEYNVNKEELKFLLDVYMSKVEKSKKYFVLKIPYFLLICLDFLIDYFQHNIVILNVKRPKQRVIKSFLRRGEDETALLASPEKYIRQIKRLNLARRKKHLTSRDATGFFADLYDVVQERVADWNRRSPELPIRNINIEEFAMSRNFLCETLRNLGLSTDAVDQMFMGVNKNRLLAKFTGKLRRYIPQSVVAWLLRVFKKEMVW